MSTTALPSPEIPIGDVQDIYFEALEGYRPGHYHPVHIGNLLDGGRYTVVRKLGHGTFSTVWLARDTKKKEYVAIKILISSAGVGDEPILTDLFKRKPIQAPVYVTDFLRSFELDGPNGHHMCLVFEPMGPNIKHRLYQLPQFQTPIASVTKIGYPIWMTRSILKHSLQALAFLHSAGIAHGDFHQGNLLFHCDISKIEDEAKDLQPVFPITPPPDGTQYQHSPLYRCNARPLKSSMGTIHDFKNIKLCDLGSSISIPVANYLTAHFFNSPPGRAKLPPELQAPEILLTGFANDTVDIWSFGCMIFELITGCSLFSLHWSPQVDKRDNVLLNIFKIIGPFPNELRRRWSERHMILNLKGQFVNAPWLAGEFGCIETRWELETFFEMKKPTGIDRNEAREIQLLLRRIFQYDPAERPSAAELLQEPWFARTD
ncbi:putative serine protein kinase [Xylaria arbuscula]|nr:putative serine protein kinase [Xylaria arbuscula]